MCKCENFGNKLRCPCILYNSLCDLAKGEPEPGPIGFAAYEKAFDDVIKEDIKEIAEKTNELSTSETLIIGVDKYGTDVFSLTVGKLEGLKTSIKKVFYGDEAEALYKKLINK